MSRFSMTEDLRDCHADELPRTKLWLRAFVASKRFQGAARAEAANATQLAIYDALIVKYAPGPGTGPRRVEPARASRLLDADGFQYRTERRS